MDERPGLAAAHPAPGPAHAPPALTEDERFALRPEDFRILASDTRVAILKALDQRQMTGTELGKHLGLEKSTIAQHLDRLVEGGLVQRKEDDRLWVYYALTPRGRRLLHPPRAGFTLLLSGSLLSAGASLTLAASWFLGNLTRPVQQQASDGRDAAGEPQSAPAADGDAPAAGGSAEDFASAPEAAASEGGAVPVVPLLAAGCFALAALLGAGAWLLRPGKA